MSLQAKFGALLLCLCVLSLAFGCSDWKFVRREHLTTLADGVQWYVERVEPRADLSSEEVAKVNRVGLKLIRNSRALAEDGPAESSPQKE